jgi:hypothetical protein
MLGDAGQRALRGFKLVQSIIVLPTQSIGLGSEKVIASPCAIPKCFK